VGEPRILASRIESRSPHVARRLTVPPNVALYRLPACPPELQPVEPLWPLLREEVANRELADLAEFEGRARQRAQWLADHPEVARGAVGFHWAVSMAE
jgi:hypothetical protein